MTETRKPIVFNVVATNGKGVAKVCHVKGVDAENAMMSFDIQQPFGPDFEAAEAHVCGEADPSGVI